MLKGVLLVLVKPNTDTCQNGRAQRGGFFHFGYHNGSPHHIGFVLHPELVAHRPADGHEAIWLGAQAGLQGVDDVQELVIQALNDRSQHVTFSDKVA